MALADQLTPAKPKTCAYAKALPMLTKADAATLTGWMDGGMPATQIARLLRANGTPYVSDTVLSEHRRGDCVCGR